MDNSESDVEILATPLMVALDCYDAAARKFLDKCADGRARSVETKSDLQACMNAAAMARETFRDNIAERMRK